eukprot:5578995-Pyramimonas_sp.AAC.1
MSTSIGLGHPSSPMLSSSSLGNGPINRAVPRLGLTMKMRWKVELRLKNFGRPMGESLLSVQKVSSLFDGHPRDVRAPVQLSQQCHPSSSQHGESTALMTAPLMLNLLTQTFPWNRTRVPATHAKLNSHFPALSIVRDGVGRVLELVSEAMESQRVGNIRHTRIHP